MTNLDLQTQELHRAAVQCWLLGIAAEDRRMAEVELALPRAKVLRSPWWVRAWRSLTRLY